MFHCLSTIPLCCCCCVLFIKPPWILEKHDFHHHLLVLQCFVTVPCMDDHGMELLCTMTVHGAPLLRDEASCYTTTTSWMTTSLYFIFFICLNPLQPIRANRNPTNPNQLMVENGSAVYASRFGMVGDLEPEPDRCSTLFGANKFALNSPKFCTKYALIKPSLTPRLTIKIKN